MASTPEAELDELDHALHTDRLFALRMLCVGVRPAQIAGLAVMRRFDIMARRTRSRRITPLLELLRPLSRRVG